MKNLPLIGICLLTIALIFIVEVAFAWDTSYTQERQKTLKELHPDQEVHREPTVQIDRYSDKQFRGDETVLIAGGASVKAVSLVIAPEGLTKSINASISPDIIITTTYEEVPDKYDLSRLEPKLAEKVRRLL